MLRILHAFKYAFQGLVYLFKTQANARFHLGMAAIVVLAGTYFNITKTEWITITICIVGVIGFEAINTAIEALCDAVHPEQHPLIKAAKDVGAAAVLLISFGAVICGILVFWPYILRFFS